MRPTPCSWRPIAGTDRFDSCSGADVCSSMINSGEARTSSLSFMRIFVDWLGCAYISGTGLPKRTSRYGRLFHMDENVASASHATNKDALIVPSPLLERIARHGPRRCSNRLRLVPGASVHDAG